MIERSAGQTKKAVAEGRVWDVAVPILGGQVGGARVGLSAESNQTIVDTATREILTATGAVALLAIAGAFLLALPISLAGSQAELLQTY